MDNNIKVIDEHNIDRVADKICAIDVGGSNYVVYSIERDEDNDNIFVSKLISNINNTWSMMNIEDTMEKDKLSSIVKEMIKYAVDAVEDKFSSTKVSLPGVTVIPAMVEKKEQNINVSKTYITTVKKSVVRVSKDFYSIELKDNNAIFKDDIDRSEAGFNEMPTIPTGGLAVESTDSIREEVNALPTQEENSPELNPTVEGITEIIPKIEISQVQVPLAENKEVLPTDDSNNNKILEPVKQAPFFEGSSVNLSTSNSINKDSVTPIPVEVSPILEENVTKTSDIPEAVKMQPIFSTPEPVTPMPVEVSPVFGGNVSQPSEEVPVWEGNETQPNLVAKTEAPVDPFKSSKEVPTESEKMVFDASKEMNLNAALGEVSSNVAVNNIDSVREFGMDNTVDTNIEKSVSNFKPENGEVGKVGFANNKLIIVIMISLFVIACCFLGYEVFRYFQAVK